MLPIVVVLVERRVKNLLHGIIGDGGCQKYLLQTFSLDDENVINGINGVRSRFYMGTRGLCTNLAYITKT